MFEKATETVNRPTVRRTEFDAHKPLLATPAVSTRPLTFHQVMIDKTGPGERTHELHVGSTDLETRAILLAQGAVEDVIARICMDVESNMAILKKMFPTKDGGYLDTRNPHFTAPGLQEEIKSVMAGYASGTDIEIASMLYVTFIADLLKGTAIVQPSRPLVTTTQSLSIFVDPKVIMEQVKINSLMMTLDTHSLTLNLGRIQRLTPKYFISEACKVLSDFGIALIDDQRHAMYLRDAQLLVQYYHHPDKRFTHLPVDVREDINLKNLAGNLSFSMFALASPVGPNLITPAHLLSKAVAYVASVLNKSPRMEIIPIDQVKKYVSHMQVKSPKSKVVGAITWRNMNGAVRTQAARFVPMNKAETIHCQQPQKIVEEMFDSIGSKMFSNVSGHKMGEIAHEVMTNIAVAETKPYNMVIGLSDFDVMHYAVAIASATYLRLEGEGKDVIPALVYEVHHDDNYLGSVGTYGEKSLLKSAFETVTLSDDNVQNVEVTPRVQGIKDDARKGFYYGKPEETHVSLAASFKYNMDILGKKVRMNVNIEDLLGIYQSTNIMVRVPIVNKMVLENYHDTIKHLRTRISRAGQDKRINAKILDMMLAMNVNQMMSTLYSTSAGKSIVKTIIFKILESLDVDDVEPFKIDLYRAERQIDMHVWSALIMLVKMGVMNYDQMKLFRNMITNEDMVQALLLSSDFDFSEV